MKSVVSDPVISHWHHPIENFHTSTQDFYAALEGALKPREIPGIAVSRMSYKEGGLLSGRREYLRVQRQKLVFDICAASFGTGYFFSWWLTKRPIKFGLLRLLAILAGLWILWTIFGILGVLVGYLLGSTAALTLAVPLSVISMVIVVWLLGTALRNGTFGEAAEEAVIETPIIGWLYVKLFAPSTYYKIDTTLMFQASVHAAVLETVVAVTEAQGLRPLTELERKPAMRGFLGG